MWRGARRVSFRFVVSGLSNYNRGWCTLAVAMRPFDPSCSDSDIRGRQTNLSLTLLLAEIDVPADDERGKRDTAWSNRLGATDAWLTRRD